MQTKQPEFLLRNVFYISQIQEEITERERAKVPDIIRRKKKGRERDERKRALNETESRFLQKRNDGKLRN